MNKEQSVIRSLINPNYLLEHLRKSYTLGTIETCKAIKYGGSNDIFLLSNGKNIYIVKVFFMRKCWTYNEQHYLFELKLQEFLCDNDFNVPRPIKNIKEKLLDSILLPEGFRFFSVYNFVDGKKWDHSLSKENIPNKLGASIAKFHNLAQSFINDTYTRKLDINLMLEKSWFNIDNYVTLPSQKIKNNLQDLYYSIKNEVESQNIQDSELFLIHGDVHAGNHLYKKKSNEIILIDFELCGYGYYGYEFAVFKWDLLKSHKKDFVNRCMDEFFEGYSTIKQVIQSDIEKINLFLKIRTFFMLGSSFLFYPDQPQFNNPYILEYYINRLKNNV